MYYFDKKVSHETKSSAVNLHLPQNVGPGLTFCRIPRIANNRDAKLYQVSFFARLKNITQVDEELYFRIQSGYRTKCSSNDRSIERPSIIRSSTVYTRESFNK